MALGHYFTYVGRPGRVRAPNQCAQTASKALEEGIDTSASSTWVVIAPIKVLGSLGFLKRAPLKGVQNQSIQVVLNDIHWPSTAFYLGPKYLTHGYLDPSG